MTSLATGDRQQRRNTFIHAFGYFR